jgi:hypothetical protein
VIRDSDQFGPVRTGFEEESDRTVLFSWRLAQVRFGPDTARDKFERFFSSLDSFSVWTVFQTLL